MSVLYRLLLSLKGIIGAKLSSAWRMQKNVHFMIFSSSRKLSMVEFCHVKLEKCRRLNSTLALLSLSVFVQRDPKYWAHIPTWHQPPLVLEGAKIIWWNSLSLLHPGGWGFYMSPLEFFKITPKQISQKRLNFVSFIDAFFKKIPVNDITACYDDITTKNCDANFTIKSLFNSKINEMLVKSHLRNILA